ncbi:NAD dependent dehydratase [Aspergillus ustus]|uniref:NAD dependent dehydratase n=1 Tax=Aspergillus ustus TaxID=40382 RepID=A0A0C1C445_ASPUT|nr:NAD dependent dehydratase [Aspergillus ustus]
MADSTPPSPDKPASSSAVADSPSPSPSPFRSPSSPLSPRFSSFSSSSQTDPRPLVLVTGGTGFLAKWVIATLLSQTTPSPPPPTTTTPPYRIRTTLRSLSRIEEIKSSLREASIPQSTITSSLEFLPADLSSNDGWTTALKDVTYVQHIASPFPAHPPKDEYDLIIPAVEGTKRVLRAAKDAGVRRVVLTSSFAAIAYGARHLGRDPAVPIIEDDWTDLSKPRLVPAYAKSKTLAEQAAWELVEGESGGSMFGSEAGSRGTSGNKMELVVINPVNIYGPALGREDCTTFRSISEFLEGNAPGIPRVQFGVVDVRDCAALHVLAMTHAAASAERFICIGGREEGGGGGGGMLWMEEMARILRTKLGEKGKKVPALVLPDVLVRGVAMFMPVAKLLLADLGVRRVISGKKAREMLGWESRYSSEEAILAAAESILKFNGPPAEAES